VKGKGTLSMFSSKAQHRKYTLSFEVNVYLYSSLGNCLIHIKNIINVKYILQSWKKLVGLTVMLSTVQICLLLHSGL